MTVRIIGGGLILLAAVYGLWSAGRYRRQRQALLWSLVEALGYMETAIRWQRMPLPQVFQTLARRECCGPYFERVAGMLQSNTPLQCAWEKVFRDVPCGGGDILCRIALEGDGERLEGALRSAREELAALCRHREEAERQQGRVRAAAVLSAACLVIILLL